MIRRSAHALAPAVSLALTLLATRPSHAQLGPLVTYQYVDSGVPPVADGPPIEPRAAPPDARGWARACSFQKPICVYGAPQTEPRLVLAALASAESAWDVAIKALALPAPDADTDGTTRAYRIYLVDRAGTTPSATLLSARDVRSTMDRATAFTLVDRALAGCALDGAIAREVVRASLWRVAPATDDGSARAETAYLARLIAPPCATGALDGADRFQGHPQHALVDTWSGVARPSAIAADEYERGAALFYWWLDAHFGNEPGDLVRNTWALTPTGTALGAWLWNNHPNGFDVLRTTFKNGFGPSTTLDDLFVRFAVARAFFGAADDGAPYHLEESRALGDPARVALDWGERSGSEIAWPAKARRFVAPEGVAPSGAAYVLVHMDGAPTGAKLRVEAEWESFTRMRWVAVMLDGDGKDLREHPITGLDRATSAQASIYDLEGAAAVLLVGVALGDWRYDFDPDDVWEPHGWMLTVAAE